MHSRSIREQPPPNFRFIAAPDYGAGLLDDDGAGLEGAGLLDGAWLLDGAGLLDGIGLLDGARLLEGIGLLDGA